MCGIVGTIERSAARPRDLSLALHLMAHRGPDGARQWHETLAEGAHVALGHRRLSIIDLSEAASQPMADVSGRYRLVFNGEIYNYLEVAGELRALGAVFRTRSDSEVILEAYKRWGAECLARLNGMFAFAIWDRNARCLFAARDRYGEKPFVYVVKPAFFAFASEYKALLAMPEVGRGYDEVRLLRFAYSSSTGLDADRQTVFDDIAQLLPGEALEIDAMGSCAPRIWRYYQPRPDPPRARRPEADLFAEFRDLLTDAVRIRMRSDVPVGSCLSGGLDSSAIVCLVRRLVGEDAEYHTFTGAFPGTYADETRYADAVVRATRVASHKVVPAVDRFIDELPEFMWLNELPVGGSSQFAQWCVFRLAQQHGVTVLLDGQGSDELLGGYEQYFPFYVAALKEAGERERLARELPGIRARYPLALAPPLRSLRDRLPFHFRHRLANRLSLGTDMLYGLRPEIADKVRRAAERTRLDGFHALSSALCGDSFGRFLTTLLRYGDRNSMAHSREVRLPFCDHRLADFVFSLPPQLLMGEVQTKRLLRESMRGILPEGIRTRWNKQGFNPPQEMWFQSPRLRTLVGDTLATEGFRNSPYWIPARWEKLLARFEAGEHGLGWTLWQPLIIEAWRRHFVGRLPVGKAPSSAARTEQPTPLTAAGL